MHLQGAHGGRSPVRVRLRSVPGRAGRARAHGLAHAHLQFMLDVRITTGVVATAASRITITITTTANSHIWL